MKPAELSLSLKQVPACDVDESALGHPQRQPVRDEICGRSVRSHRLGRCAKVCAQTYGGLPRDAAVRERLIEEAKADLVELDVFAVAGMDTLDIGLIAVAARVERGPSGHLGEVGGQALRVLRVKPRVGERMFRDRIGDAELMPAPAHGEERVEAAEFCIQPHAVILPRNHRGGYPKSGPFAIRLYRAVSDELASAFRQTRTECAPFGSRAYLRSR